MLLSSQAHVQKGWQKEEEASQVGKERLRK
jgi:hypothetical protein